jgi:hypothetical protein
MVSIAECEAECGQCGCRFQHPWLGDFSYGEAVFATADGSSFAIASAQSPFARRVAALVSTHQARRFWEVLAGLADPLEGQALLCGLVCPWCFSREIARWGTPSGNFVSVREATFESAEQLESPLLARRVAELLA